MSMEEMNHCEEQDDTNSEVEGSKESPLNTSSRSRIASPSSTTSTSPAHADNSAQHEWLIHHHSDMSDLELNVAAALCSQRPNRKALKKHSPAERLQRSRERNRMHARKTRQRKKEQMQTLQGRVDDLKQEQIRLKQSISEKQTASILVGLFSTDTEAQTCNLQTSDPLVEELLLRQPEDIPDTTKIPELPALILPGNHKKARPSVDTSLSIASLDAPNDGIDYALLGKDRSKCSSEELDRIRRERNRMHAKRTRDRKRIFMDNMEDICKKLEAENVLLRNHLATLDGDMQRDCDSAPNLVSPMMGPSVPSHEVPESEIRDGIATPTQQPVDGSPSSSPDESQLDKLLEVAGACCKFSESRGTSSVASAVSASTDTSVTDSGAEDHDENFLHGARPPKKRCLESTRSLAITTTWTAV